ncbi:uncharacterized protein PV09_01550 [Verruconis gallopava]|uniref:Heterokaryon incompatibility domain-containing protein n=1 Tax=Verruconis gallopava TaxID=253628 RepID=A0A0D2B8M8_9PEZI|nr:uncharacterized protein PV09_01550 [Verruconis gallopava]KIW07599.1 hypothetical protein PV09_01550 [Verruconis gallopava]
MSSSLSERFKKAVGIGSGSLSVGEVVGATASSDAPASNPSVNWDELKSYRYDALNDMSKDIRLMTILPDEAQFPIRVSLEHVTLERVDKRPWNEGIFSLKQIRDTLPSGWEIREAFAEKYIFTSARANSWTHPSTGFPKSSYIAVRPPREPHYEALSYTWGEPGESKQIIVERVDTRSSSKPIVRQYKIEIRKNLYEALLELRDEKEPRTMWVDAICINQDDIEERNEQVLRMGDIFQWASRVVIWLGPESGDSELAMRSVAYIGKQIVACTDYWQMNSPDATERGWGFIQTKIPYSDSTWTAIEVLLRRPWFERLWVAQEAVLADATSIIKCGSSEMLITDFRAAVQKMGLTVHTPRVLRAIAMNISLVFRINKAQPLNLLLLRTSRKYCTDRRDRIYAVLGIAQKGLVDSIIPDYSINHIRVFRQATLAEINYSKKLDVLEHCHWADHRGQTPTWVPRLSGPLACGSIFPFHFASGYSAAMVHVEQYNKHHQLIVEGIECATVDVTGDPNHMSTDNMVDISKYCKKWVARVRSPELLNDVKFFNYLIRVLCLDEEDGRTTNVGYPQLDEWKRFFVRDKLSTETAQADNLVGAHNWQYDGYCKWAGRAIFLSEDNIIGVASMGTQPGDIVAVLLGHPSPVILRPVNDGTYKLVGDAFVPELSDANALLGPLPYPWIVQCYVREGINFSIPHFVNIETGKSSVLDPRLPPLEDWEIVEDESDLSVWTTGGYSFRNKKTGEKTHHDPRMRFDALKNRGVNVRQFRLI